jgi:uncharacterized protein (TIGR02118 family)
MSKNELSKTVAKVVALYNVPEADQDVFNKEYFETHIPLVKKVPGLLSMEICKTPKNLMGGKSPYYMIATLTFADLAALKAGMASPEGQEAGNNIMSFASNYITLLATEVESTNVAQATASVG